MSGERAPAVILKHPAYEPTLHPHPDHMPAEFPTEEQFQILAIYDGLSELVRTYGAKRVMTWIRSLAAIHGQEI